ncbi:hypothetical protein [Paraburkholderia humisilvae]|uniref:hypothetical protein n=1 Tax=Paraburkholderia humisilvae TaxID=627669 RepID=UPI001FE371A6|nr:hypothetical protein [Paraburkholderia humisilvae]
MLAVTAEGFPLGVPGMKTWIGPPDEFGKTQSRKQRALFAVISWHILYAILLARPGGDLPCEVLLQPVGWRALYCRVYSANRLPVGPPSLGQAVL